MLRTLLQTAASPPPPSNALWCRNTLAACAFSSNSQHPKLAYEWIVDGKVVPATMHEEVPEKYGDREVIVFLHGLLGNAKNLRTPAKKLTERLPHLSALCLDIRGHGNSTSQWSSPHTIQSCTLDVRNTLIPLGLTGDRSPTAFCGHSLGGRIALQYSSEVTTGSNDASSIRPPKHTWILDSVPGQPDPSVHNVLNAISSIPLPISSKNDVITLLMEKHRFNKAIAMWIASNLKPRDGGLEWIFDLQIANELVSNFAHQNFHQLIENVINCNKSEKVVHLVMAGRNKEWTEEILDGLRSIPGALEEERFRMHRLERAGHWVHVDDLEGLLDLMVECLKR